MYNVFAVSLIFNENDSIYLVDLHKRHGKTNHTIP